LPAGHKLPFPQAAIQAPDIKEKGPVIPSLMHNFWGELPLTAANSQQISNYFFVAFRPVLHFIYVTFIAFLQCFENLHHITQS